MSRRGLVAAGVAAALALAGCSEDRQAEAPADTRRTAVVAPPSEEHAHKPGAHGGLRVPIGLDNYHAEAVVGKDGVLRIWTLGKDESRIQEVSRQRLTAFIRPEGDSEAVEVVLEPAPQSGDAADKTSQFQGQLPAELRGKSLVVTVPSITINGERFRFGFTTAAPAHAEAMPAAADESEERELYEKPGGMYTAADIQMNGSEPAAKKYKGIKPVHDAHPKSGDTICPVSRTKANPKFGWYVGGKRYTFCCTPCIGEFVRDAKQRPERILDPSEYIQQ